MKRLIKFSLFLLLGLAVFLIVLGRVGPENIIQALSLFLGLEGLVIILITLLFVFFGIFKWRLILKDLGHSFSLKQVSPLWLLCFTISYLTPFSVFGGEFFRIYFTKKRYPAVSWQKSMASVAIDKILDATVFFVFMIVGLLVFAFYGRLPSSFMVAGVFVVAAILLFLLLLFYFKRLQSKSALEWALKIVGVKKEKISNHKNGSTIFEAEKEVFRFFSPRHKALWKALGFTFLRYLFLFLRGAVLIFFLTGSLNLFKSLAVYGFANLASLTPIPATLGALELGEGFVFKVLGFGFGTGTVFSMIWRGADLLLCIAGLVFLVKFSVDLASEKLLNFFDKIKLGSDNSN